MHLWRAERDRALARRHARAPRGAEDPQVRQARCLERAKTLIEDGELSRACRLLHDTGMAPLTTGLVDQLRRMHPPRRTPMPAELPGVFSRVPSEVVLQVGKAGLGIPDSKLAARARRAAADGAPAPPRERICGGFGLQLETACLPGDHINERSCAIRDVVAGGDEGPLCSRAAAGCARPPA